MVDTWIGPEALAAASVRWCSQERRNVERGDRSAGGFARRVPNPVHFRMNDFRMNADDVERVHRAYENVLGASAVDSRFLPDSPVPIDATARRRKRPS